MFFADTWAIKPISKHKNTPYGGYAVLHMGDVLNTIGGISYSMVEGREDRTQRVGVSPRDGPIDVPRLHAKDLDSTPLPCDYSGVLAA